MDSVLVDTNLLLDDPEIPFKLLKYYKTIAISLVVLQELDRHKFNKDLSFSARKAINSLLEFKSLYPEKLRIIINEEDISTNDQRIIRAAQESGSVIATKDIAMSLIAESKSIKTKLYGNVANGIYDPYFYLDDVSNFTFKRVYDSKEYDYSSMIKVIFDYCNRKVPFDSWFFVMLPDDVVYAHNPKKHILERIDNNPLYRSIHNNVAEVRPRDKYQICAVYALIEADNVLITGKWGSGKSLLATAYAIVNNNKKTFISRPPMGIDSKYNIGFLPGSKKDKLEGWAMGFLSAAYFLYGNTKGQNKDDSTFDYVKDEVFYNIFELIDINSLQGLSLLDDFLLVDEVQLCSIDLMSMLLSRANKSSKIILTGDLAQSYGMRPSNSGLLKLLRAMPHESMAYVDLKFSYRSALLELAEKLQDKTF